MFVSYSREKLLNAIIYFVANTKHCHTLKLFKLLNFLDFEHFRQTGQSVTGLNYKAWENGPAPSELWHELRAPAEDLASAVVVTPIRDDITDELLRRDLKPRRKFDGRYFSPRELEIMERLVFFFAETRSDDMSEVSHARNLPWGKVFQRGKGQGSDIPYELMFESASLFEDMPPLSSEEYEYRKDAFAEIDDV